ncbi:MAG TPA: histidine kinase dimerization/phospho-acceptor domain-containing protein, partial [Desulfosporosinus sp.]|nr:histidine kinase dimerization/phospho-acceptor domain-containing protein [Desulfosporosinus sp.]
MLSKISLRLRLTILTCSILILVCACLTIGSVFSAGYTFYKPLEAIFVAPSSPVPTVTDPETVVQVAPLTNAGAIRVFENSKKNFTLQSILLMVVITGIGTILTWVVVGKALKPVATLSKIIEDVNENNLRSQIPVPRSNDEVARLTHSFNNMLEKLSAAFDSQKRFAQNAAHELKTPLSAILTNIEVMEIDEDSVNIDEYKETLLTVKQNAERMATLVTDLLFLNATPQYMDNSHFSIRDLLSSILND